MTASPWWLATLLAPASYYALVGRRFAGFTDQPRLVLAFTPTRFAAQRAAVGGAGEVRKGVLVDLGFLTLLNLSVGLVIAAGGGQWKLAAAAASLDVVEGAVLWTVAHNDSVSRVEVTGLSGVATAKFAVYAASWVAGAAAARALF